MAAPRDIPEPGELVYRPRPSWAPAFFAFAAALAVIGIFVDDSFMLPGWFYSAVGVIVMIAALRNMVAAARTDYYRLPRRQRARSAVVQGPRITPPRD